MKSISRRLLLKGGAISAVGLPLIKGSFAAENNLFDNEKRSLLDDFRVGVASYTFRKFSLEETIKALLRLNLKYISVKDFHIPLNSTSEERKLAVQKLKAAGITPLSCGNITMENDEQNIRRAFEYARDCGIPTIVCSPHPASMAILDRMVKTYNIKLAIHNHGPEDKRFPSPYDVWKAVKDFDARIGLCIDVGHTARAKVDPAEAIINCKERLYDLHFKDINTTEPKGDTIEAGRGVLDLPSIIYALEKIKFRYLVGIEYEGAESDPLPAVAETVGYAKGLYAGKTSMMRKDKR
jgi:sugar phosphate isomerase/epimerase